MSPAHAGAQDVQGGQGSFQVIPSTPGKGWGTWRPGGVQLLMWELAWEPLTSSQSCVHSTRRARKASGFSRCISCILTSEPGQRKRGDGPLGYLLCVCGLARCAAEEADYRPIHLGAPSLRFSTISCNKAENTINNLSKTI